MFFDRGFAGRYLFWLHKQERSFPIEDWTALEKTLMEANAYAIVYCGADNAIMRRRHVEAHEQEPENDVMEQQRAILKERVRGLEARGVPVLWLDTSHEHEDRTVEKILRWAGIIPEEKLNEN